MLSGPVFDALSLNVPAVVTRNSPVIKLSADRCTAEPAVTAEIERSLVSPTNQTRPDSVISNVKLAVPLSAVTVA